MTANDLQILIDAANNWANEMGEYIIPAVETDGEAEAAARMTKQMEAIGDAAHAAAKAIEGDCICTPVVVGTVDTRSFEFTVVGSSVAHAQELFQKAWAKHSFQTGADPEYCKDEALTEQLDYPLEVKIGTVLRDGELLFQQDEQPIVIDRKTALEWFIWLCKNGKDWHMDDNPEDCFDADDDQLALMKRNHQRIWESVYADQDALWHDYYEVCTAFSKTVWMSKTIADLSK